MTKTTEGNCALNVNNTGSTSKIFVWGGRVLVGLVVVFMFMDGIMKLIQPKPVIEATTRIGFPTAALTPIGIVLIICTFFYLFPRSAVFGAILLTGYLGGAVATQVHAGAPLFETFFPVIFGVLIWGGLFLRDSQVRALIPVKRC